LTKEASFRFRRTERLKGRDEIREVFGKGRRVTGRGAKLYVLENCFGYNRICFSFPRNYGTAVERNRSKRLGREAYRNLKPCIEQGYDVILLVYSPLPKQSPLKPGSAPLAVNRMKDNLSSRSGQLRYLFLKAGLLK
jgi:ribonuclease P protein component